MRRIQRNTATSNRKLAPALTLVPLFLVFLNPATAQASVEVPADEKDIIDANGPVQISLEASKIQGLWGKCLKSLDTRCYYMNLNADGSATIYSYISSREKQFDNDPGTDGEHCYNKSTRQLARVGQYSYLWQDMLGDGKSANSDSLMKIVVAEKTLYVFNGEQLQLSLPAADSQTFDKLTECG